MSMIAMFVLVARSVLAEWRRNYRDRRQLASLSSHDRYELSLCGDVDAEIAKPFWRK